MAWAAVMNGWIKGDPWPGLFAIDRIHAFHAKVLQTPQRIDAVSSPTPWSYAFGLLRSDSTFDGPVIVDLELVVDKGVVGIGGVADDLKSFVGAEETLAATEGPIARSFYFANAAAVRCLIFRNAGSQGPCLFSLLRVACWKAVAIADVVAQHPPLPLADLARWCGFSAAPDPNNMFEVLRRKWGEVPAGLITRRRTSELLELDDGDLLEFWKGFRDESTTGKGFAARGWYHALYADIFRGRKVMDVGSGLGVDGLTFAMAGADMTFVDIVADNLRVLRRLAGLLGVTNARFLPLQDLDSLDALSCDYDVIWCQGSLINAPFEFTKIEAERLLRHLPVGGRWIELAYPRERWEREGRLPFTEWGVVTDGVGTPWVEWYDLEKLFRLLAPARFEAVLSFNFHNEDFNWFDLVRRA